jgi:hypothetical protein
MDPKPGLVQSFIQKLPGIGGLLGSGMAQQAAGLLSNDAYRKHVQESQAMGQAPLPLEQWMQQQNAGLIRR